MVKTTMREAQNNARFTDLKELKGFLNRNSLIVKGIEKIAYTAGIYGCNGYMTKNNINKKLIEQLTITHQQPETAYIAVLNGCKTQEQKEQVKKIAKKYKINII